jgi:hypothetical protein
MGYARGFIEKKMFEMRGKYHDYCSQTTNNQLYRKPKEYIIVIRPCGPLTVIIQNLY